MARYAAFLRGVNPMNAKMPEVQRAFEGAGFTNVKTFLSSGNVAFEARARPIAALQMRIEDTLEKDLGTRFLTVVRSVESLRAILKGDPYKGFPMEAGAKRVVTFLREPPAVTPALPIARSGASILCLRGTEAFSAYIAGPQGPVFMILIQKAFGKDQTTRTWQTVEKVAR